MKKLFVLIAILLVAGCLFAQGNEEGGAKTIAILAPNPTHDWTGSVGVAAEDKAEEINAAGVYKATVLSSADATAQISQIEDITANENYDAVVILPMDNTVEAALTNLVNTGIPVVQFDRLIGSLTEKVVANVMGDNNGIGYETAKRFLADGLTPNDKILLLAGDLSSVPGMRTDGFKSGLKEAGWTDAEIKNAINDLGSTGWQRSEGERLFTDWLNGASAAEIAETTYIFSHDDPVSMGVFDALTKTAIEDSKKEAFLGDQRVVMASSAGAAENYAVLAGAHKDPKVNALFDRFADYFSVSYTPYMMKDAIQIMVDYLDGKDFEKTTVLPSNVVDKTNVQNFQGFGMYN